MTLDEARAVLNKLESELSQARDRKLQRALDVRKACAAAEAGDQRQKNALAPLNKESDGVGHLVLSLEKQVEEARRRVALAVGQRAAIAANAVAGAGAERNQLFEVKCPGRLE